MLRLTGQYADGWFPSGLMPPADYAARLAVIQQAARVAGRDPATITPSLHLPVVIGPTEAAVEALIDTPSTRYATLVTTATADWQRHGRPHPLGESFRGYIDIVPERLEHRQVEAAVAAVPPALTREVIACGTVKQVTAILRGLGEAGLRDVNLMPLSAYPSQRTLFDTMRGIWAIARQLRRG
jgi:phthiodiolone/phenolphthiodiolone dimycocerosates ketoreductase